jgi:drug/metabolite transporter (DMT)-like permease
MQNRWWAASELLLATMIWGFGFIAVVWAQQSFDSISISVFRFAGAFLIGLCVLAIHPDLRKELSLANLMKSLWPGLFLGSTIGLQSWGLETTTATNSSFITTLYVVIVPLIEALIYKKRLPRNHGLWVLVALVGTGFMIQLKMDSLNKGDVLTFFCAIAASLQIVSIGRASDTIRSPFAYNVFQSFWCLVASLAYWPIYGRVEIHSPGLYACIGLFSVTILSTLLAFFLQVKAQKVLSPSVSSLIFLLESPFATIFAIFFLHERLTLWQCLGGLLIFVSALKATRGEAK